MVVMLAMLCGRFEWALAPRAGGVAGVREREVSRFTLAVDGGLWLVATPRA